MPLARCDSAPLPANRGDDRTVSQGACTRDASEPVPVSRTEHTERAAADGNQHCRHDDGDPHVPVPNTRHQCHRPPPQPRLPADGEVLLGGGPPPSPCRTPRSPPPLPRGSWRPAWPPARSPAGGSRAAGRGPAAGRRCARRRRRARPCAAWRCAAPGPAAATRPRPSASRCGSASRSETREPTWRLQHPVATRALPAHGHRCPGRCGAAGGGASSSGQNVRNPKMSSGR